jgi:hypothetical protein
MAVASAGPAASILDDDASLELARDPRVERHQQAAARVPRTAPYRDAAPSTRSTGWATWALTAAALAALLAALRFGAF